MKKTFAVCVKNDGYKASLELRKLYEVLADDFAASNGLVRVIDESGEDYLYGADYFASVSCRNRSRLRFGESLERSRPPNQKIMACMAWGQTSGLPRLLETR